MSKLKFSTRTIFPKELDPTMKRLGVAQCDIRGYFPVYQWGYARMDASTPGKGVSTSCLASCISVVLHNRKTNRTIVTHSPNYLIMQTTFGPMVEWIVSAQGGVHSSKTDSINCDPTEVVTDRLESIRLENRRPGAEPLKIQVAVIRGTEYATPLAVSYGHEKWMRDFHEFFKYFGLLYSFTADILDVPPTLPAGALLVDKENADITFLDLSPDCNVSRQLFKVVDSSIASKDEYSMIQQTQDLFIGSLLCAQGNSPGINLQFDVDHYLLPMKLTDEARDIIRSKDLRESEDAQSRVLRKFGQSEDWITKNSSEANLTRMNFQNLMTLGPVCERCGKRGTKKCSACKGAWYCSAEHQQLDWSTHKKWCRAHKLVTK